MIANNTTFKGNSHDKPINIASVRENLEQLWAGGDKNLGGTEEQFYQLLCYRVRPNLKDRKWVYLGMRLKIKKNNADQSS